MKVRLPKKSMKSINQMQEDLKKLQQSSEEIRNKEYTGSYTGSSGSEIVKVTILGDFSMTKLEVSDDVYKENDKEMLQDLIISTYNIAWEKVNKEMEEISKSATSGLNIHGLV